MWSTNIKSNFVVLIATKYQKYKLRVMVFNAIFNNISAILWLSVLMVEETGVPGENHPPAPSLTNFIT
jgi:hypothetical protein